MSHRGRCIRNLDFIDLERLPQRAARWSIRTVRSEQDTANENQRRLVKSHLPPSRPIANLEAN